MELIEACRVGNIDMVQSLVLQQGANIQDGDIHGLTPLMHAAGAHLERRDAEGLTSLAHAVLSKHVDVVRLLVESGADVGVFDNETLRSPLTIAINEQENLDTEIVRLLVKPGANINSADINGRTPLILATSLENVEIVRLLLDAGANPNILDNENQTALDYAVLSNHDGLILLLEH
ncbi:hypothetical protein niasHS_013926 [Heterodera schachtii]|uniref:Ankyrin n=1 Tax=Heterodera schachtii TaxID=97005 RepID=A0ABD2IHR4_HETSC